MKQTASRKIILIQFPKGKQPAWLENQYLIFRYFLRLEN